MKIKKIISLLSAGTIGGLLTTTLTSCVGVDKDVTDNIVNRGDGSKFSTNTTFINQVKNALISDSGSAAFKKSLSNDLIYSWYKENIEKLEKKDKWKELEKEIKEAYDKKVETYKNDHKQNWEYYFQNEVLDPVGGTEELYKKNEMVEKARSAFTSNVFDFTKYLTLGKVANADVDGDIETVVNKGVLENSDSWEKINFYGKAPGSKYSDKFTLPMQFARVQKETFEEYTAKNNPISISMALWKYGDPKGGIESLYNKDLLKDSDLKASFNFPAFSSNEPSSGGDKGTQEIFDDFVKGFNSGNYFVGTGKKLINIPKSVTEDSETQIIVNLKHLFDNNASSGAGLETIFAASVGELVTGNANIAKIPTSSLTFMPKFDLTTDYEIGKKTLFDIFFNQNEKGEAQQYSFDFSNVYPDKPIKDKDNANFDVFNEKSKYYSSNVVTSGKTSVKIESGSATPFILTRDEFGVHFIAIDGWDYLNTKEWSQKAINDVLKVKSVLYREYPNNYSKVDIDSAIKSYFDTNINDIILKIALKDAQESNVEKETVVFKNAKNILGANANLLNTYFTSHENSKQLIDSTVNVRNANEKINEWSKNYSKNFMITNYGSDKTDATTNAEQLKNGLATPLQFKYNDGTWVLPGEDVGLATTNNDYYNAALVQGLSQDARSFQDLNKKNISSEQNKEKTAVESILQNAKISANIVKSGMAQWSENILAKGDGEYINAINAAIIAFTKDGNSLANSEKSFALSKYIKDNNFELWQNNFSEELNSIYYSKKFYSNDKTTGAYTVLNKNTPITAENWIKNYINYLKQTYYNLNIKINQETSDEYVNELILGASITYLAKENSKNLIEYLRSIISWDNPGAVVWLRKDISGLNSTFSETKLDSKGNADKVYGWSKNYVGETSLYDSVNVKLTENAKTTSFAEFDQYWSAGRLPISSSEWSWEMGYSGLQTANSSSLPSVITDAIFTNPGKYGNETKPWKGVLARYKSSEELCKRVTGADARSIRDLSKKIKDFCSIGELETWSNLVSRETYQDGDADCTSENIGKKVSLADVEKRFKTIDQESLKKKLTDEEAFQAINGSSGAYLYEPKDPLNKNSSVLPEKEKSFAGYRTTYLQINNADLYFGSTTVDVQNHLIDILGGANTRLLQSIIIQYAQDASIQSRAIADVIKNAYGGKKVDVFSRAMNDELGQAWVNDWKKKP